MLDVDNDDGDNNYEESKNYDFKDFETEDSD